MKKFLFILLSILFVGCAAEQEEEVMQGTFMLKAESGYIAPENEEDAVVYIIDTYMDEVYVDGKGKTFTREEREKFETMTSEEREALIKPVAVDGPTYKIKSLEITEKTIVLSYAEEFVEFTALSDSYFETESGVRYQFIEDASVLDYEESLRE